MIGWTFPLRPIARQNSMGAIHGIQEAKPEARSQELVRSKSLNKLISFFWTPSLKDSSTSQYCHRLMIKLLTVQPLGNNQHPK